MSANRLPGRVFLDSSTLQTLQDYGEFIYDGGRLTQGAKIWLVPDGPENLEALRPIVLVGGRGSLQLALSSNSLKEVRDRRRHDYLQWAMEVRDYWEGCLASYGKGAGPFTAQGVAGSQEVLKSRFGYLSTKDARLIHDALLLECDVFLTMEEKLPRNAAHLERELGLKVLRPVGYWQLLTPWAALLA